MQRKTFGRRAKLFNGYPNLERILEEEREGKYITKRKSEIYRRGKILVLGKALLLSSRLTQDC